MDLFECKKIFERQLCDDYGLTELPRGVTFVEPKPFTARARNYLYGAPYLDMVLFDGRLLVCVDRSIAPFVKEYVGACAEPFRAFDAPNVFRLSVDLNKRGYIVGRAVQGYLPHDANAVSAADIVVLHGDEIGRLYEFGGFDNALCYSLTETRRDTVAVARFDGGVPIAIAACTNDAERLWQIGIDVRPEYRRRGIAAGLVSALKAEVLKLGICPFYCCAWSNVASQRTATAAGFLPEWAELSAEPLDAAAGYSLPTVVFWNVDSRTDNMPVTMNESGVILVSGSSPSVFAMLKSGSYSPYSYMLEVLSSPRYAVIKA